MLWRNFDRGLPLISKLPPAAGQLWEASTMCSAPLPGLSLLYPHTLTCLHPVRCTHPCTYTPLIAVINQAYLVCTSYLPCTMSVSQVCSLAPGKATQFLLRGTAADYSLMSLLSLSDKSPPLASSVISHDSSLCLNLQCRKYEQFV